MPPERLYLTGASGSGVTTLGAVLAAQLESPQIDVDSLFWEATEPPFQTPRPLAQRRELLLDAVHGTERWILSGSLDGWGDVAIPRMQLVVFLAIPAEVRLARLHERGVERLLVEGGGELNWALVAADLVDEIYVTIAPTLLGGSGAPTLLGGEGLPMRRQTRLRLVEVEREGDELFCRYAVRRE